MRHVFLYVALFLMPFYLSAQSVNRIEVKGILLSSNNDVEAVTIFNKSSSTGTITDIDGKFKLNVALNDVIEISALQFQTVTVTIDDEIITSKALKIQLIEKVNQLDAVTLSSGLTGNIETDIANVKTVKSMRIDMGNMDVDFEYNDDKAFDNSVVSDHYISITDPNARKYMPNLLKIVGLLFKNKKRRKTKKDSFVEYEYEKPKSLIDVYTLNDIEQQFNIPEEELPQFIAFIENKGIPKELFEPESKFYLIEFLVKQSKLFLELKNEKN